jgi:hypothetical protein
MKTYKIECNYVISSFKKHLEVKDHLLKLIEDCPSLPINDADIISKTDWYVPSTIQRPYINFLIENMKPDLDLIMHELKHDRYKLSNYWFQQYETNNTHKTHQHTNTTFACVYYLEFPEDGPKTSIIEPHTEKHIQADVKEGDILVFPAHLWHYSPPNLSDKRKTVIAINIE